MKAYKGFDKNLCCRGFQFKEGVTYHEDEAELCIKGFHACLDPLECFKYYYPANSVYHEVEIEDVTTEKGNDSKVCGKTIKVGKALDIAGIVKAKFEYTRSKCIKIIENGDAEQATAGEYGSATAGEYGSAAAGEYGLAVVGEYGSAVVGYRGSATTGNFGSVAAGNRGSAAVGDGGSAAAGNYGLAAAGNFGSAAVGECGSAAVGEYGSATAGNRGSAAAGNCGSAAVGEYGSATAGNFGSAATGYRGSAAAGNYGLAAAGNFGSATAGNCGKAVSGGNVVVGNNGAALARGKKCKAKGGIGAVLVIVEENKDDCEIKEWQAAIVDGKTIKPDTWYTLKKGKFVETSEEQ